MPYLPDRFDLWVRRARETASPDRQADFVLGALMALPDWYFLNVGTGEAPQAADAEVGGGHHYLVFSDARRIEDLFTDRGASVPDPLPLISMPPTTALPWMIGQGSAGCAGILVNPGDFAALVPLARMAMYYLEWQQRGGTLAQGFWIPNLTSEEEDFWQEHGL